MNVYDEAHNLSRAIKESEEFKQYDKTRKTIKENPDLSKMMEDFQAKQMEIQTRQMMGEAPEADMMGTIQELYSIIMKDPIASEHLQNELRFSMMMKDVYQILGDAIGLGDIFKTEADEDETEGDKSGDN